MQTAKVLWSSGSVLINGVILAYVWLSSQIPDGTLAERYEAIGARWTAFDAMWRMELAIMALLTISSVFFAVRLRSLAWTAVACGHLVLMTMYPVMIGGYHDTSVEVYSFAYQASVVIFVFGNAVFLAGLVGVYQSTPRLQAWLKWLGTVLAGIALLAMAGAYAGTWDWRSALMVGPLMNVLYLLNAYLGVRLPSE